MPIPTLLVVVVVVVIPPSTALSPDAQAMQSLASSLHPLPPRWSPTSDPCAARWTGVTCSPDDRVTSITLPSSALSGTLPPTALSSLPSLLSLSLPRNSLSGPVPPLPSSLQVLSLSDNNFTSLPPSLFSTLPNLLNLSLDRIPFASPWPIPSSLSLCTHLSFFSAMSSRVSGPLPAFLGSMPSLKLLRLSYNGLTGSIPVSFSASPLVDLALNNQDTKLSGPITVLASMTQLQTLMLQSNNFSGPVPDLSNLTSLSVLSLRDNRLTGPVPPSLAALPALRSVELANNLLQGPFPAIDPAVWADRGPGSGNSFCNVDPKPCDARVDALLRVAEGFGYPAVIAGSWKGDDPCTNWMFVGCDPQGGVRVLNFAGQGFGGTISTAIAEIVTVTRVILSGNGLTGTIPEALAGMPQLQELDVSDNNLSGKVPAFDPKVKFTYTDNPLIGKDLGGPGGSGSDESPVVDGTGTGTGRSRSRSSVWIAVVVVVVCLVGGGIGSAIFYRRKKPSFGPKKVRNSSARKAQAVRKTAVEIDTLGSGGNGSDGFAVEADAVLMSMQDLRKATGGFSDDKILGKGGFGVVYKGELQDGTLVAVKRMECGHMGKKGMTEFHAEIAVLTKVRHRHLVALLGYCVEGNERLLVYEYMAEGTLGQHLFEGVDEGEHAHLSWKQRLVIALDVARGLEYLHNLAHRSFIHRDLKPSNILLDSGMRAKVSDFGLVKLAPDDHSVQTRLAGTFGYLAPEYATTGKVTTKVDVYAFGVVLMELITSRKALDESLPDEHTHLVSWFCRILADKNNFRMAVDPRLELDPEDLKSVIAVAELAGHCTAREAQQRPDMGHAVNVLAPLVDQWKPSSSSYGDSFNMSLFRQAGIVSTSSTPSTTGL